MSNVIQEAVVDRQSHKGTHMTAGQWPWSCHIGLSI